MAETSSHHAPSNRQVLVSFGNRWVVFGSPVNLPRKLDFGPSDGQPTLPRVADESEHPEQRLRRRFVFLRAS
jgi:hypothetical protein